MKYKLLVVGASGFVGRHLSRFLADNQEVDLILTSRKERKGMLKINDYDDIPLVDLVIHLGGSNVTHGDNLKLLSALPFDLENSRKILRRCERAIYVSSAYVYKDNGEIPINIFGALETRLPYSCYKQRIESIFLESNKAIVVRPSNLYGHGMSERSLMMGILRQAKAMSSLKVKNCFPVRDYLHVKDFVNGISLLGEIYLERNLQDCVFNFGTGVGTSVRELCAMISLMVGFKGEIECSNHRKHTPSYLVLEAGRTSEETRWFPSVSLETGLEAVINTNQR